MENSDIERKQLTFTARNNSKHKFKVMFLACDMDKEDQSNLISYSIIYDFFVLNGELINNDIDITNISLASGKKYTTQQYEAFFELDLKRFTSSELKKDSEITRALEVTCPACNSKLYTYYHEASYGDPATGTWNVECSSCDYEDPEEYASLMPIETNFIINEALVDGNKIPLSELRKVEGGVLIPKKYYNFTITEILQNDKDQEFIEVNLIGLTKVLKKQ